jgi:hypothetical protein
MPLRGTAGTGFAESHRSATVLHPVAASAWSPNPGGNTPGVKPDERTRRSSAIGCGEPGTNLGHEALVRWAGASG